MMLRIYSLLLVLAVFTSCQKDEDNSMDFKITGIRDTVIERGQSFSIPLKVFYLGGTREEVTISSVGNGNGVTISYNPVTGEPDFSITQYITASATADTGFYTITVTGTGESDKKFSKSFSLHVTEVANSAPVLVLTQGDTVVHRLNDPWFDPGYVAIDPEDGDITSQVQASGTVNENLMGSYVLSYSITDSDGLTTTATRLVRVLNDLIFVNGNYNCTSLRSGSPPMVYTTTLAASLTQNNHFTFFKIGNNFQADPNIIYNPVNDSLAMSAQTFMVGTVQHTFAGTGKIINIVGSTLKVNMSYTDSYIDTVSGMPVVINVNDFCEKQ